MHPPQGVLAEEAADEFGSQNPATDRNPSLLLSPAFEHAQEEDGEQASAGDLIIEDEPTAGFDTDAAADYATHPAAEQAAHSELRRAFTQQGSHAVKPQRRKTRSSIDKNIDAATQVRQQ